MFDKLWQSLKGDETPKTKSDQLLLWILRGCFGAILIGLAMTTFRHFLTDSTDAAYRAWTSFLVILFVGTGVVIFDMVIRNKQITTISAVYFGLLLGLLLGNILSAALDPFIFGLETNRSNNQPAFEAKMKLSAPDPETKAQQGDFVITPTSPVEERVSYQRKLFTLFITVVSCYICISTLLQTKDEFRFIIPYVEFAREIKGPKPLLLDTSVIIDGRIADICDTRLVDTPLIIPRFVLQELQAIADSSDKLKRNRGRRGLDMLKRMQNNTKVDLEIHPSNLPELRAVDKVDERLVVMAKAVGARVVTNDYNLNKIAQLQGVEVINLNELANAMKSVALPGEAMTVRIVKAGDQIGQGVGYLDDGTMVVVEQGRSHIGNDMAITVTSVLQTPAGRMIFGKIDGPAPPRDKGKEEA